MTDWWEIQQGLQPKKETYFYGHNPQVLINDFEWYKMGRGVHDDVTDESTFDSITAVTQQVRRANDYYWLEVQRDVVQTAHTGF